MPERHDCREHLPPAATDGSVAQCPSCEAWWQYLVTEHEMGAYRRWRRVRWWMPFARHEVEQERARRALYELLMGIDGAIVPKPDESSPDRPAYDAARRNREETP